LTTRYFRTAHPAFTSTVRSFSRWIRSTTHRLTAMVALEAPLRCAPIAAAESFVYCDRIVMHVIPAQSGELTDP
jgi:hypothetical protein